MDYSSKDKIYNVNYFAPPIGTVQLYIHADYSFAAFFKKEARLLFTTRIINLGTAHTFTSNNFRTETGYETY